MTRSVARREPWAATIHAPTVRRLRQEIGRAHKRGELAASGPILPVPGGGYAVQVYRLKDPARRVPVAVWVAGGAVAVLGGAAALGWWLVGVTAPLIVAWAPVAAGVLAVRVLFALLSRPGCTITHRRG